MKISYFFLIFLIFQLFFIACRVDGCTDPLSLSYNKNANHGDNSCTYPERINRAIIFKKTSTRYSPTNPNYDLLYDWENYLTSTYGENLNLLNVHFNYQPNGGVLQNDQFYTTFNDSLLDFLLYSSTLSSNIIYNYDWFLANFSMFNFQNPLFYSSITEKIDTLLNRDVKVAIALEYSTINNVMDIKVQCQRYNYDSEDYNLSIYIMEDNIVSTVYNGITVVNSNFIFNNIFREEITKFSSSSWSSFTVPYGSYGVIGSNVEFTDNKLLKKYSVELENNWNSSNCYPIAVIWKRNESLNTCEYLNSVSGKN
tara:strand:- start:384 stop:1316 length:933 start_codon:yes stop_codon:yes gene_type:complete